MEDCRFFPRHDVIALQEIAKAIGAQLLDGAHADAVVTGVAPASCGGPGDLSFIVGKKYAGLLAGLEATALICPVSLVGLVPGGCAVLVSAEPKAAFARAAMLLYPGAARPQVFDGRQTVSPTAHVHPDARLEEGAVTVEAGALVGAGAHIGAGTTIGPGAVIGPDCRIGRNCTLSAGVTVQHTLIGDDVIIHPGTRIGQDGFGYAPSSDGAIVKLIQIGRVIIQDRVEVGANTTIDRGALDDTVIGEGSKIDNLVHIAHNVRVGRGCAIFAHCCIGGSVTIGDSTMINANTTVRDHLTIGDRVFAVGTSTIALNVPDGARLAGNPARPLRSYLREIAEGNARLSRRNRKIKPCK